MLRKQEEMKEKVKEEAYYEMKIEECHAKSKNLSLDAKDSNDGDGTYQIWSSGSDKKEMWYPTHGIMYPKNIVDHSSGKSMFGQFEHNDLKELERKIGDESEDDEEMLYGRCFVTTTSKSFMADKVNDLLIFL